MSAEDKTKIIPFQAKAGRNSASLTELTAIAIWPEKGIPFQSPDGKIWILSIDDTGNVVIEEITE